MEKPLTIDGQLRDLKLERKLAAQKVIRYLSYGLSKQILVRMLGSRDASKVINGALIFTTLMANLPARGRM